MKIQTLEKIIKNKSIKKEFAIITNLQNGSSEVYEPGKKLSEEFSKFTSEIESFYKSMITTKNSLFCKIENLFCFDEHDIMSNDIYQTVHKQS